MRAGHRVLGGFSFDPASATPDRLVGVLLEPNAGASLVFDRVDAIDAIDPPAAP